MSIKSAQRYIFGIKSPKWIKRAHFISEFLEYNLLTSVN